MIGGNKLVNFRAPLCRWEEAISRAMQGQGENSVVFSPSCAQPLQLTLNRHQYCLQGGGRGELLPAECGDSLCAFSLSQISCHQTHQSLQAPLTFTLLPSLPCTDPHKMSSEVCICIML